MKETVKLVSFPAFPEGKSVSFPTLGLCRLSSKRGSERRSFSSRTIGSREHRRSLGDKNRIAYLLKESDDDVHDKVGERLGNPFHKRAERPEREARKRRVSTVMDGQIPMMTVIAKVNAKQEKCYLSRRTLLILCDFVRHYNFNSLARTDKQDIEMGYEGLVSKSIQLIDLFRGMIYDE